MPVTTGVPTSTLTLGVLIESVIATLYGQAAIQDRTTALTQNIDPDSLSFTVEDASGMQTGLIEIDTELMRVKQVDMATNMVYLYQSGRGSMATLPATHFEGALIRVQPVMTYSAVAREVQAELNSLYPGIARVESYEFTSTSGPKIAYEVPADVGIILDVRYKDVWGNWQRVRSWEVEFAQNTTDYPSGVALRVTLPYPGTPVRVVYGKPFGELANLGDRLADAGVPASVEDILRLGALIRLLPSFDLARLSVVSVPANSAAQRQPQPDTGVIVGRELERQHQARLIQEGNNFRHTYPVSLHMTR